MPRLIRQDRELADECQSETFGAIFTMLDGLPQLDSMDAGRIAISAAQLVRDEMEKLLIID